MGPPSAFLKPVTELDRQRLGKYEIVCRLSSGGMSEIFLAAQQGLADFRKIVVLKSILPDIRGAEDFVRMFLEEARITASFNHPNIAQVFDLDTDQGTLFLAMEFVQGATLTEIVRGCQQKGMAIPLGFTLTSVRDTALALHYAHTFCDSRGRPLLVVHRDVSGKNVMVTYEGTTKLLDFGIAKSLGRTNANHTSIGMVKGTSGYMSPEQVQGEPLDPRTDVFSLGVVLHESLTGNRLFSRGSIAGEMRAVLEQEIQPPSHANPEVSPALDQVTMKALCLDREQRFGTALEFARALEAAGSGSLWHPEQLGALVKELYAERLQQTQSLIKHTQGATGEHSGIHRHELSTDTHSAVLPWVPERSTDEHVRPSISTSPAQSVARNEETTSPLLDPAGLRRQGETKSMRAVPPLAPTPAPMPYGKIPTVSQLLRGGVPAFRPDGDVHDSGKKPAVKRDEAHPYFAGLTLDDDTVRGIPPVAPLPEPQTTVINPRAKRGGAGKIGAIAVTVLAVAAGGGYFYGRAAEPVPAAGLEPKVEKVLEAEADPAPVPAAGEVEAAAAEPAPAPEPEAEPEKAKSIKKGATKKPPKKRTPR